MSRWWKQLRIPEPTSLATAEMELFRCLRRIDEVIAELERNQKQFTIMSQQVDSTYNDQINPRINEAIGSCNRLVQIGHTIYRLAGEGLSLCSVVSKNLPAIAKLSTLTARSQAEQLRRLKGWVGLSDSYFQRVMNDMKEYKIKPDFEEEMYYGEVLGLKGRVTRQEITKHFEEMMSKYRQQQSGLNGDKYEGTVVELGMIQLECAYNYFKKKYSF